METHYENLLKKKNLSLTAVRLAVLEALRERPHADAACVYDLVRRRLSTASRQAIFNNLHALVEHGIIREIKPKGRPSLYETRTGDNHHHLICRRCQLIVDTDCPDAPPCLTPSDDHGFSIDEAEVILWGTCPQCKELINKQREK